MHTATDMFCKNISALSSFYERANRKTNSHEWIAVALTLSAAAEEDKTFFEEKLVENSKVIKDFKSQLNIACPQGLPSSGQLLSVSMYPTEFGLKCMEIEAAKGLFSYMAMKTTLMNMRASMVANKTRSCGLMN